MTRYNIKYFILTFFFSFLAPAFAADLVLTQTSATPNPVPRGGEFTYSTFYLNADLDTAAGVQLVVDYPENDINYTSSSLGGCSDDGDKVTCSIGSITGDPSVTSSNPLEANFVFESKSSSTNTTAIFETSLTTASNDTDTDNNDAVLTLTVVNSTDIEITSIDATPATVISGGDVDYTINIRNNGALDADGITVENILSPNTIYQGFTGTDWSCVSAGSGVDCQYSQTLSVNEVAPLLTINAQVISATAGNITFVAEVESDLGDADPDNNTKTEDIMVTAGADLQVKKSLPSPNPVGTSSSASFDITVTNHGPFAAESVSFTDTLPTGFSFDSSSGNSNWSCASGVLARIQCDRTGDMPSEASEVITLVLIAPDTVTEQTYINEVTVESDTDDPDLSNNDDDVDFLVLEDGYDLSITKSRSPSIAVVGSEIENTIIVHNAGPNETVADDVVVTDTYNPSLEEYVDYYGNNWNCVLVTEGEVRCTYNAIIAVDGESSPLIITTKALGDSDAISNLVVVSSLAGDDPIDTNNDNSATIPAVPFDESADLSIEKAVTTDNGDNVLDTNEDTLTFTLTVTNNGPDIATGVTISDTIPGYLSGDNNVSTEIISQTTGLDFSCSGTTTVICNQAANNEFMVDGQIEIEIKVSRPILEGSFTNYASVSTTETGDSDLSNNNASASFSVKGIADVQIQSKTVTPSTIEAQTVATYVITYKNDGPNTAKNVIIKDQLSSSDTTANEQGFLVRDIISKGTCTGLEKGTVYRPNFPELSCNVGDLVSGETGTIQLLIEPLRNTDNNPRTYSNSATISTDTPEFTSGGDGGNNSGNASLVITEHQGDILVSVDDFSPAGPDPMGYTPSVVNELDNVIIYRVQLTNVGASDITNPLYSILYQIPTGESVTFLGSSSVGLSAPPSNQSDFDDTLCTNVDGVATEGDFTAQCQLSTVTNALQPSETKTVYIAFVVNNQPASAGAIFPITVVAFAQGDDPSVSNNIATDDTTVKVRSDVSIAKQAEPNTISPREPFLWTITVTNNGPLTSYNTMIEDQLPTGMRFLSAADAAVLASPYNDVPYISGATWQHDDLTANGTCEVDGEKISCEIGDLTLSKTATITIPVRLDSTDTLVTPIENCAEVVNDSVDPDNTNNEGCAEVTVTPSSISGFVFSDLNTDGNLDTGDAGIADVRIFLTGSNIFGESITQQMLTASDGSFEFDQLDPADTSGYILTEVQPILYADGQETAGNASGIVSADDGLGFDKNRIYAITLGKDSNASGYLFAEVSPDQIRGYVFADNNDNGIKDTGEAGISGVTITLLGTDFGDNQAVGGGDDKTVTRETSTDTDGAYQFLRLGVGNYQVVIQPNDEPPLLDNWVAGNRTAGEINNILCTSCTSSQRAILNIDLNATGIEAKDMNFAELKPAKLSGIVYEFLGQDGDNTAYDATRDRGIKNVTLILTGKDRFDNDINLETQTDANGLFTFSRLVPTIYQLTETQPTQFDNVDQYAGTLGGMDSTENIISDIGISQDDDGQNYQFAELRIIIAQIPSLSSYMIVLLSILTALTVYLYRRKKG